MRGKFKFIIFVFILCLSITFLLSSNIFAIKNIRVDGNKSLSKEAIIRLSSLQYGKNIFKINKMYVMKAIFQDSHIKMIKIRRSLPNTIVIDVIEREAIALVPYVGSYLNIDEEGIVIEINPSSKKVKIPIIKGLEFNTFKLGEYLNIANKEQFDLTKNIIAAIKGVNLVDEISIIDVTRTDNIQLTTVRSIQINLGNGINLKDKIPVAKAILEDVNKKQLKGIIDMSYKGNPILKQQ